MHPLIHHGLMAALILNNNIHKALKSFGLVIVLLRANKWDDVSITPLSKVKNIR